MCDKVDNSGSIEPDGTQWSDGDECVGGHLDDNGSWVSEDAQNTDPARWVAVAEGLPVCDALKESLTPPTQPDAGIHIPDIFNVSATDKPVLVLFSKLNPESAFIAAIVQKLLIRQNGKDSKIFMHGCDFSESTVHYGTSSSLEDYKELSRIFVIGVDLTLLFESELAATVLKSPTTHIHSSVMLRKLYKYRRRVEQSWRMRSSHLSCLEWLVSSIWEGSDSSENTAMREKLNASEETDSDYTLFGSFLSLFLPDQNHPYWDAKTGIGFNGVACHELATMLKMPIELFIFQRDAVQYVANQQTAMNFDSVEDYEQPLRDLSKFINSVFAFIQHISLCCDTKQYDKILSFGDTERIPDNYLRLLNISAQNGLNHSVFGTRQMVVDVKTIAVAKNMMPAVACYVTHSNPDNAIIYFDSGNSRTYRIKCPVYDEDMYISCLRPKKFWHEDGVLFATVHLSQNFTTYSPKEPSWTERAQSLLQKLARCWF